MLGRALVVLLLMLNLGVALWWVARPAPVEHDALPLAEGVARLQLLREAPLRPVASTPAPTSAAGVAPNADGSTPLAPAGGDLRCFALGPFVDAGTASRARTQLAASGVVRARPREVVGNVRGWSVAMPPLADRAAADAMAARIREAGFEDLFIVPGGESANSIALGRYGNESSARQRVATLKIAGFEAGAQPIGDADTRHWIDIAVGQGFDVSAAQRAVAAPQSEPLDCATLRQ